MKTRTDSGGTPEQQPAEPPTADPFAPLGVIEQLEVGPIRVEKRRVVAPYTVERVGVRESTELIYRYEEDVFDDTPEARNLAAMIAAQVALNYGLFCKTISFVGEFDEHDRVFLESFAENTAREIYVNKFLLPNPFLTGAAGNLSAVRQERYSRARIECVADPSSSRPDAVGSRPTVEPWADEPPRYAVLSSGGKDSLTSFGILRELGHETHPIFINESGRHWYTALNAYRHFADTHPLTARVWTNSDRVFAWMLRHLPFVRSDFARLRSDEYPVRLWTVAVFLFGALPLLRKRRVGRLLIGDEFDTTVKVSHRGITHYNALYDQSRWFDNEMTRYFRRKSWGVYQFSILRQLSELLVEKVLSERYPDLLQHQVSCHAAHLDGDRVRPCGSCEKCRRIVGMLTALGADPTRCGYSHEQIERCLRAVVERGVHQETVGAEQLAYLLRQRGAVPADAPAAFGSQERPEVMSLRFDPVRAPIDTVPSDLRPGLHRILLQHAAGAVTRKGRSWRPFNAMSRDALMPPYRFETRSAAGRKEPPPGRRVADPAAYLVGELTWPEAEARFKQVDVALLPVGAVEQHGPHLPLDTDAYDADFLCRRVAEACSTPKPLVLPLIAYGVSYHHDDFVGTFSVNPETQARLVYEIGMSAARCGVTKLVIINGHGGNAPALHLAAQMINRDAHIFTCVDTGETSDTDVGQLVDTQNDVHAGEIETSTTLANRPHLVKQQYAVRMVPRFSSRYLDFTSKRSVGWYAYTKRLSESGVMGDATKASAAKGEQIWEVMTQRLVELVEDLKRLSLDEIFQRRY